MVFNCNINAFSRLTSSIDLYNENMNLEMTIKKLGSIYKFRVGRATGNEDSFIFILARQTQEGPSRGNVYNQQKAVKGHGQGHMFKIYSTCIIVKVLS